MLPAALLVVLLSGTSARSATVGTISTLPATGGSSTVSTFTTSGVCAAGDTVTLKVFGGSGVGAVIATPATAFSPKNMNGAIDAATYVTTAGDTMVIGATQTWKDFATTGSPPLSRLNGVYTVRAWCSSGDWFEGTVTFTGTTADNATYSTTTAPTPTPTPTSASPKPTTASPTLTSTGSPSPTLTATTSPTPAPASTDLKPGEHLGIAVGPDGDFLVPNATLRPGDNVTVIGGGFAPTSLLKYSVFSQEVVFGYGYADANGSTSYRFVVPDLADGQHRFAISGASRIVVFPFTLGAASPSATVTATSGSSDAPSAEAPSASGGSTNHLAATGGSGAELTSLVLLALLALAVGANLRLPRLETGAPQGRHVHGGGRPIVARQAKGRHQ